MRWSFVVLLSVLIMVGCSSDSSDQTEQPQYLNVENVSSANSVKAGWNLSIDVTIDSATALSSVPVVISAVKSDDQNDSVYWDTVTLESISAGQHIYTLDVIAPRDTTLGEYIVIANVDPDDLLGEWRDETQFKESEANVTVLEHGPDEVVVSGGVDSDDSDSDDVTAAPARSTGLPASIVITATDQNISIDASLTLYPKLADLNQTDVNVTACVHVGSTCIDLPLWSSEGNGTLSNVLQLYDIEYGYETLVAVDSVVPYTVIATILNEIVSQLSGDPFSAAILDTTLDVTLTYNGQQKLYPIGLQFIPSTEVINAVLNPAPQRSATQSSSACAPKVLDYSKVFQRYKYGKLFGAGAYLKGQAGLDGDGIHSKVYASVKAKALGNKDRFMKLNFTADALPGSFEGTGYDLDVEVLGISVYTKTSSLADVSGLSTPEVTEQEEAAIDLKIANGDANVSKVTLMKQKVYKKANQNISTYSGSGSTAVGYVKDFDFGKKKGYTQQYIVGIVPVKITAGAQATVGYIADIQLSGITSVTGSFKPKAGIGAYVLGGVGVVGYSAGVEADLWLLNESLRNSVTASLDFVEDNAHEYIISLDGNLHEKIYNYFKGPNGKLYLYAEYGVPKYCKSFGVRYICGVRTKTRTKYLGKWKTSASKATLLDEEQTLFSIPLDDCN